MEEKKQDSQVEVLKNEIIKNHWKDTNKALENCEELKAIAERKNDASLLGFTYYQIGQIYYIQNNVELMFQNLAKALNYLDQTEQWGLMARAYNLMAIMSIRKGNVSVGMEYYLNGISYCREYGIVNILGSLYLNLGCLYLEHKLFQEAMEYFKLALEIYQKRENEYMPQKTTIYTNLATCYMLQGDLKHAKVCVEKLDRECAPYYENVDFVYVDCMKVQYYDRCQEIEKRDHYIEEIRKRIKGNILIMDIFDDLYFFCLHMLRINRDDVLLEILEVLEPIVEKSGVANISRRTLSLKIQYFQKKKMQEEYVQALGHYYELTELMEADSQSMFSSMLYVRSELERENERRKQMEKVQRELKQKSETDALTGLANRYRLNEYLENIHKKCVEKQSVFAVEILDVDYFKEYNDNYGHQAGDSCLKKIAEMIGKMQEDRISCARYGGDEFVIIYQGMDLVEIYQKARWLREHIMGLEIEHGFSRTHNVVTISQGICYDMPAENTKSRDFLQGADRMLYQVKKESRNAIRIGNLKEQIIW